jgi:mannose-1-phosphate guanylyltransferase
MPDRPDAIILCGGAGVRLREITGYAPKAMAGISERPFLELLLRQLRRHGYSRVILAVGYRREVIIRHFGGEACGLKLIYSSETRPLGTGGAIRNAVDHLDSDVALIMNGDSYTDVNLDVFLERHRESKADVSLVLSPPDGRDDCGTVRVEEDGSVSSFTEKQGSPEAKYINAGVYLLPQWLLRNIPQRVNVSLEQDLMALWLEEGRHVHGFISLSRCIDIGTPERYRAAQAILTNAETGKDAPHREGQL